MDALERGALSEFGALLHEHWQNKKRRAAGITADGVDRWYAAGREAGAAGGKLVGAGGGGFLLLFCENGTKDGRPRGACCGGAPGAVLSHRPRRRKSAGELLMRVLVTGGAGFIGSHTVDLLLARGYEVSILDSLQERVHPNGPPSYLPNDAELVVGDVSDRDALAGALEDCDVVLHLAAYQDYQPDFSRFIHTNTESSALIFELVVARPGALPRAEARLRVVTGRLRRGQVPLSGRRNGRLPEAEDARAARDTKLGSRLPVVRRPARADAARRGDVQPPAHGVRHLEVRDRAAGVQPRSPVRHRHRRDALHVRPGIPELVLQRLLGDRTTVRAPSPRGATTRLLRGRRPATRLRQRSRCSHART